MCLHWLHLISAGHCSDGLMMSSYHGARVSVDFIQRSRSSDDHAVM